jgi:molybdopterin-containing oxidoreductase family iron-sulfur binding subunit
LYDPDRASGHSKGGAALKREQVDQLLATMAQNYAGNQGTGLAILAEESSSPTRRRLVAALRARLPRALWSEYEPITDQPPVAGAQAAFGSAVAGSFRSTQTSCKRRRVAFITPAVSRMAVG